MASTRELCDTVLEHASASDPGARIASVSTQDVTNATLVRVSCAAETGASMIAALRRRFPLASVALVENVSTGDADAQLLLPDESECRTRAASLAQRGIRVEWIRRAVYAMSALFFVVLIASSALQ